VAGRGGFAIGATGYRKVMAEMGPVRRARLRRYVGIFLVVWIVLLLGGRLLSNEPMSIIGMGLGIVGMGYWFWYYKQTGENVLIDIYKDRER
jgi:hypothetical protein